MLILFVNILNTDYKYFRRNTLNLTQQFEAPLSQKQKTLSRSFLAILKCAFNLENLKKIDEYLSLLFSGIINSERGGYLNV